jgi:transposase
MKRARKTSYTKTSSSSRNRSKALQIVHPNAGGIDVGASSHYVAVRPDAVPAGKLTVRYFGTLTVDLDALVEWLKECAVDTVAMEATGVYWIPLFQKIEAAGIEVLLANARYAKHVPGRKSDVQDCQWLQQLHSYGLLEGSFRPPEAICRLRTLVRHRANLVGDAAQAVLHMQKALIQMNVQLHQVVNDLCGETGLRILRAILKGERDPEQLVQLRDPQITRSTPHQMMQALKGDWRPELLFVLQQNLKAFDFCHQQIKECDGQIENALKALPTAAPVPVPSQPERQDPLAAQNPKPKRAQSHKRNEPQRDLGPELARICGTDLTKAHGLRVLSVLVILSEIGTDMKKWRNAKAFSSWLGLCPNNKISGGRVLSSRSRQVVNRAATALRMAASGVAQTETWLGSFYRRMRARLGPAAANTATAHKIATVVYHLLRNQKPFVDRDLALYEQRVYRTKLAHLRKQAATLGYQLVQITKNQDLKTVNEHNRSE